MRFAYWRTSRYRTQPDMGCERSKIEHTVCQIDKEDFLSHWKRSQTDNRVISSQSSSDISFLKFTEKDSENMGSGSTCPTVHWYGELPKIVGLLLLALFILTVFRRWQNKQRQKSMKKALSQTLALQTVSSSVPYKSGPDQAWQGLGSRCLD